MQEFAVDPKPERFAAHPLAQLASAFAVGILGAQCFLVSLSLLIPIAALATLLTVVALLTNASRASRNGERVREFCVATLFVTLSMLLLGATLATIERVEVPSIQIKRLINEGPFRWVSRSS
jgi:NADH:ubiquinone oxidoreductase subunit 6 (subunit J)